MKLQHLFETETETENAYDSFILKVKENGIYDEDRPLYRHMNEKYVDYGVKEIRQDRKPKDSRIYFIVVFNELFKQYHNIDFIRAKVAFTSTSVSDTEEYGINTNYIFPIQGSKIIYNSDIQDSIDLERDLYDNNLVNNNLSNLNLNIDPRFVTVNDIFKRLDHKSPHFFIPKEKRNKIKEAINKSLTDSEIIKKIQNYKIVSDVSNLPHNSFEVMILGDSYYYLNVNNIKNEHNNLYQNYKTFVENEL